MRVFELSPQEAGLPPASLEELRGKDAEYNAEALCNALSGMESAHRNAVVYNAAAALLVAGKAADIQAGVAMAKDAIDSGRAHSTLQKLVSVSNETLRS